MIKISNITASILKGAICLFLWTAFLFYSDTCLGKTYYVDSINGQDSNTGISESEPLKSLKKLHKLKLLPGDKLLFKKGSRFRGTLKFEALGKEGNPIVISSYGEGSKPIFENPTEIALWEQDSKGVRSYFTGRNHCYGLFEDGEKVKQASDDSLADGRWFFNKLTRTIYYRNGETKPARYTYASSYYLFLLRSCEFVILKDLHFRYAGGGIVVDSGKRIQIDSCDFEYFYERATAFKDSQGHCNIANNSITNCGDGIYFIKNCIGFNRITNNTISYCNYNEYNNNDGHAIGIQNCSNNVITKNKISYCIAPIAIWADIGNYTSKNIIAYNLITDCNKNFSKKFYGQAINITPRQDHHATDNKIYYNLIRRCNFGVKLGAANNPSNHVFNNVFDECRVSVMLSKGANHNRFTNNIFFRSSKYHTLLDHKVVGHQNFFDNNCFFPGIENGYVYRGKKIKSLHEWQNVTGQDRNSFVANPEFIDTETLKLKSSSKCIDSGKNIDVGEDYYGNSVFQGGGVDIGISEYPPAAN